MSFLMRAALVIGALSYLAATRDQPGQTLTRPASTTASPEEASPASAKGSALVAAVGSASGLWSALPQDARQRLAQDAVAELGRRVGAAPASRDTLADTDRRAAWRGGEGR